MNTKKFLTMLVLVIILAVTATATFAVQPAAAQTTGLTMSIVGADNQSVSIRLQFPEPLQVRVTDNGLPVAGASVRFFATWTPTNPKITSCDFNITTDANGLASATVTANDIEGSYTVSASYSGQSVTFHLTNLPPDYTVASSSMVDPLDPSVSWWRDTTDQNALAQHTSNEYPGNDQESSENVHKIYDASGLTVMYYDGFQGPNMTAIVGATEIVLIGPGGSVSAANYVKVSFQRAYSGFMNKTLKAIILPDASPESSWGLSYWRNLPYSNFNNFQVYASADYPSVKAKIDTVNLGFNARQNQAYGSKRVCDTPTNCYNGLAFPWGPDGFLGTGNMLSYYPNASGLNTDNPWTYVPAGPAGMEITVNGIRVDLYATSEEDAGLVVNIPDRYIVITREGGKFLPDVASTFKPNVPVAERISTLNFILSLAPQTLISPYGQAITGQDTITTALTAQRDALQSISDQTIAQINQGATIEEAAAAVSLSSDLASSPYNQEFVDTIPNIVRSIYQDQLGWFGGNPTELASTLTAASEGQALAEALGGIDNLVAAARTAELNALDLPAAEKALYLAYAAYKAAPENFSAREVYAQTLRKNALMQKSAQIRNYYLVVADSLDEALVSDFSRSGDEDTAFSFSAEDFSSHFTGFLGSSLTKVKIASLPPAESGALSLYGNAVSAGQEIAVANLGSLIFTPAANWNGTASFAWNGLDGVAYAKEAATISLTVNPVNDAPAISSTPLADVTVDEDAAASNIDLSTGFSDVDGDTLTFSVQNSSPNLISSSIEGSSLSLSFLADQNGQATLTVTAADPGGLSVTDDFVVTVNPVDDAPWANGQEIGVQIDTSKAITLDYGDVDNAQSSLSFQVTSGPANGTLANTAPSLTTLITGNPQFATIVTGQDGLPVISFVDTSSGSSLVKVAHCSDAACSSATISTISQGMMPLMAIGADGKPVISYRNSGLFIAHCDDAACSSATISPMVDGNISYYASIVIGTDGLPVISYPVISGLKVAHCNDATCSSATLTMLEYDDPVSGSIVGRGSSITIGADGNPVISYNEYLQNSTTENLKVAHCDNPACTSATITRLADMGSSGWADSILVGADGLPIINYYIWDDINQTGSLSLAHCNDLACSSASLVTLVNAGNVQGSMMAIGTDRLPVIAYKDYANNSLKVAHCLDAACSSASITVLSTVGNPGGYSIAIGTDGLPVISYIGGSYPAYTLGVAHCQNAACATYPDLPQLTYTPASGFTGTDSFTYTVTDPQGLSATATVSITVSQAASLSGQVFNDANANGVLDTGEAGLAGVTVQLQNPDGSLITTAATTSDGTYSFAGLQPGTYRVREVLPAGFLQTTPDPADVAVDLGQARTGLNFGSVTSADLKVAMTGAYNNKSKVITYTIVVTNDGPADAAATAVIDNLSGTVSFISVTTSQGSCTGGKTVTCNFGTLTSGSSATVVLKVTRLNTKSPISNTVTVTSSTFDIDPADNSATAIVQ